MHPTKCRTERLFLPRLHRPLGKASHPDVCSVSEVVIPQLGKSGPVTFLLGWFSVSHFCTS